jgi:hypothetical protein
VKISSLVLFNFLQRRSKSYLLGTRAYLLASRVKSDYLLNRAVDFSKT